jgi:hypothetical protein
VNAPVIAPIPSVTLDIRSEKGEQKTSRQESTSCDKSESPAFKLPSVWDVCVQVHGCVSWFAEDGTSVLKACYSYFPTHACKLYDWCKDFLSSKRSLID